MEKQQLDAVVAGMREISDILTRLAAEIEAGGSSSEYGPAHAKLPWTERVLRQSLIIQDIVDEGGSVPKERWVEIAARYGYTGRGVSGFFRGGNQGLLEMRKDRVYVTRHGRERLAQNVGRVRAERESS